MKKIVLLPHKKHVFKFLLESHKCEKCKRETSEGLYHVVFVCLSVLVTNAFWYNCYQQNIKATKLCLFFNEKIKGVPQ